MRGSRILDHAVVSCSPAALDMHSTCIEHAVEMHWTCTGPTQLSSNAYKNLYCQIPTTCVTNDTLHLDAQETCEYEHARMNVSLYFI